MKAFFTDKKIQWVLKYIDLMEEDLFGEIRKICEIPAPTFQEKERAMYVLRRWKEEGVPVVKRDGSGNIIGEFQFETGGKSLLIASHLDTVFPMDTDVRVREEDGRYHAPGVGDNSSNLAGILMLTRVVKRFPELFRGRLVLAATVAEEALGDLMGMKGVIDSMGEGLDAVCVLDGQSEIIFTRGVHTLRWKISYSAPGGHSWGRFGRANAIHSMGKLIQRITTCKVPESPKTTFNVGKIEGGTAVNALAESCSIHLDMRSVEEKSLKRLVDKVRKHVSQTARESKVKSRIEVISDRPGGYLEKTRCSRRE